MPVNNYSHAQLEAAENSALANNTSIGTALTDALDAFITSGQMEPQVALKVLATFDRVVAEVLAEKVKARLSFKVHMLSAKSTRS
jgi:transcription initiation factor TFIIA small subunit